MNLDHKCQGIHTSFDILVINVASTGQVPVCMQVLSSHPNVQTAFFIYQFMNLIFIYFPKKGEAVIEEGR